ncbi:hypothetical protein PF002_g8511 [Phytophthora fragariae]|uniref:Uncharacterized protein n=1 Tax=Phytophthora fragariae TaxID=53985 RepID=A0A6A3ZVL3_9STRA|nr:hypothetical protein PF002_g8511 [Phytophthora fragariae]
MGFDGDARLEYADSLCVGLRSESRLGRSSSTAFTVSSVTVMLPYKRFERTERNCRWELQTSSSSSYWTMRSSMVLSHRTHS